MEKGLSDEKRGGAAMMVRRRKKKTSNLTLPKFDSCRQSKKAEKEEGREWLYKKEEKNGPNRFFSFLFKEGRVYRSLQIRREGLSGGGGRYQEMR